MPAGTEFIKHEFDEAIAIQRSIIQAGERLSGSHPVAEVKKQLKADLKTDKAHLKQLERFGKPYGADGTQEEVAEALASLADETSKKAGQEQSEAYEAHAVLLNLKRKQQDSADAVAKIARDRKETQLREAATTMKREIKASADTLAKSLADFAARIAQA